VPSLLPVALAAVTAALLMCGGGVEARVLLTLDDFGAVGDGIANDTQVRAPSKHSFGFQLAGRREGGSTARAQSVTLFRSISAGFPKRVERGVWLQRGRRPGRAGRQGVPDLASAALRPLQEEAQVAGAYKYRTVRSRSVRALLFDSLTVALLFVGLDFRRDRGAGEPR
jgi:hypothetical protein